VRRETIKGLVDSGAAKLVLLDAVVKRVGLSLSNPIKVRYADGRRATCHEIKGVFVKLRGRDGTFTAICESKRETAVIGAIILEDLDLLVDDLTQQVIPRDPAGATYEI
jgi:predicted aspartyl protease